MSNSAGDEKSDKDVSSPRSAIQELAVATAPAVNNALTTQKFRGLTG
ncbi:MAG: hypothetical protein K2Q25_11310 [Mycobacteriaceae bacterium]|nr:hypothetical protein [Mycobacteriaceae bacterium]